MPSRMKADWLVGFGRRSDTAGIHAGLTQPAPFLLQAAGSSFTVEMSVMRILLPVFVDKANEYWVP